MKHLQDQESFSFSTSSKNDLFSDDEDGESDNHNNTKGRISGHHQNDYFEITLPPPPPSPSATKTNNNDAKEEEFEFCFSFNSSSTLVKFPTTPISANSNHPFHHHKCHKPPMTTSTFATSQLVNIVDRKHNQCNKIKSSMNYKRILNASSPRCHQSLISPYKFPPSRLQTFEETQRGLVKNRNSTRLGGIGKFMIKLRSIKSMLRSSLNASRRLQPPAKVKVNKKNKRTSIDYKQRDYSHMTNKSSSNNIVSNIFSQKQILEEEKSLKKVNFYSFSKMLDVIMKSIRTTRRSKHTYSKSCPASIKSSPMHDIDVGNARDERRNSFYSRDHSIQAAIAHCKKSSGK
ncbi:uncharacterized protein LOC143577782 [Bidens hawaiensis]|uniref:uncharacterized protein LOC143577782 n=1 Tax=Bidens hawaiensis TaxID=980011 RepID=UPI004049797E